MKSSSEKKTRAIVLGILFVFLVGTGSIFVWKKYGHKQGQMNLSSQDGTSSLASQIPDDGSLEMQEQKKALEAIDSENNQKLHKTDNGYVGTFTVQGYIRHKNVACEPQGMCQGEFDYVFLLAEDADSATAREFIKESSELGLGCLLKGQIISQNYGDGGSVENVIEGDKFDQLIQRSENQIIQLRLTKPAISWQTSTPPSCYSQFRAITIAQ